MYKSDLGRNCVSLDSYMARDLGYASVSQLSIFPMENIITRLWEFIGKTERVRDLGDTGAFKLFIRLINGW